MWNTFLNENMNIYAVIDPFCQSPINQRAKHNIFVSAIDTPNSLLSVITAEKEWYSMKRRETTRTWLTQTQLIDKPYMNMVRPTLNMNV